MFAKVVILSIVALFATLSSAQNWTPDPFCPYPSYEPVRYPYYGNCSIFWECFEGTKYVMECPAGLEFNAPLQQCDIPEIANCDPYASTTHHSDASTTQNSDATTDNTSGTTDDNDPDDLCQPSSDQITYFPYPGDCTKYWECFEGNKYLYNCPEGLWWHEDISQCDYPGDFCDNSSTDTPTSTSTDDSTTEYPTESTTSDDSTPDPLCQPATEEITYFPYPGDCTKYWECFAGNKYLYNCPEGLWWHEEISQCDYPGDFCTTDSTTDKTTSTVTPSTTEGTTGIPDDMCLPASEEITYFPYSGDCTKFWECFEGHKYLQNCPNGLWWHEEISQCDYPGDFCTN